MRVAAPEVFSLLDNTAEVVAVLERLQRYAYAGRDARLDLGLVREMDLPGLLCIVRLLKDCGNFVTTTVPRDPRVLDFIKESGISGHIRWLTHDGEPPGGQPKRSIGTIRKNIGSIVDTEVAANLAEFSARELGKARSNSAVYRTLIEAMSNTYTHASPKRIGTVSWWAAAQRVDAHRVAFVVLDRGRGVIKTANLKWMPARKELLGLLSHSILMKELVHARLMKRTSKSQTGELKRGKGIPKIYRDCREQKIRNVFILANRAYVKAETDEFCDLPSDFNGTILYWEEWS